MSVDGNVIPLWNMNLAVRVGSSSQYQGAS